MAVKATSSVTLMMVSDGAKGSDGKGISSITHHYLVTNVTNGVTTSTSGWKTSPTSVTATNKYLWYYQTINYTTGSPTNTTPAIIGVYGDTGGKGETGKGIKSVTPEYYLSTSNKTQTGGSWKTTQDTWSSGKYYWTRDSINWNDGTTTTTTPVLATGLNNANSTANNAQTIANQTASKFEWIVKSGTSASNFTLTDRTAQLVADSINLKGLVTFKGLDSATQNKITDANNKIDNLRIGGRNLVLSKKGASSVTVNGITVEYLDGAFHIYGTNTKTDAAYGVGSWFDRIGLLKAGKTYTMSFDEDLPTGMYLQLNYIDINGVAHSIFRITSNEKTKSKTAIVPENFKSEGGGFFGINTNTTKVDVTIRIKVEEGNIATAWSPAPEDKANQSIIDNWAKDDIVDGETVINGGYIKTNTIKTNQLAVGDIFSTGNAVMNIINSQEINANRITSGTIVANRLSLYGMEVRQKETNLITLNIRDSGDITMRGSVESFNYTSGKTGWSIRSNGDAEFNDVVVRGSLITNDGGVVSSTVTSEDATKQVRFWAGTSYKERENAPWIVYNDGSMLAQKGSFSGVFTGDIKIGNISISDPSSTSGGDALLTIQNGQNGVKVVQLKDADHSDFAQEIHITDNFYNEKISLQQDGVGLFTSGIAVGTNTSLNSSRLILNDNELSGDEDGYIFKSPQVSVGTSIQNSSFKVYGDTLFNGAVQVSRVINFNNVVECTVNANGIDFNFKG